MTKEKKVNEELEHDEINDGLGIEDFNMDDFDFNFDEPGGGDRAVSKVEVAKKVASSVASGFKDSVKERGVSEVMGSEFDHNLTEITDLAKHTADLTKESFVEIKDALSSVLPKSITDFLGITRERDSERRQSEQEMREGSIKGSLDSIFDKVSALDNLKVELKDEIADGQNAALSKVTNELLLRSANDGARLTGFMLGIGSDYFRKSLELLYRSYYVQSDMLKSFNTHLSGITTQLDGVIKNTALPEHVKITQGERVAGVMKEAFAQSVYSRLWTNNDTVKRIRDNITSRIKNATSDAKSFIDNMGMLGSMGDMGMSKTDMGAQMGGGWAGGWLGRKFMEKMGPRMQEWAENRRVQNVRNTVNMIGGDTETGIAVANDWVERQQDKADELTGVRGAVGRGVLGTLSNLLGLTRDSGRKTKLDTDGIRNMAAASIFDKQAHTSITHQIPTYLSEILFQMSDLNLKYSKVNGVVGTLATRQFYNFTNNKLSDAAVLKKSVVAELQGPTGKEANIRSAGDRIIDTAKKNLSLNKKENRPELRTLSNPETKEMMYDYINTVNVLSAGKTDLSFDTLFKNALTDNADPYVKDYVSRNPALTKLIKTLQKSTESADSDNNKEMVDTANSRLGDINEDYPTRTTKDVFDELAKLVGAESPKFTQDELLAFTRVIARYVIAGRGNVPLSTRALRRVMRNYAKAVDSKGLRGVIPKIIPILVKIESSPEAYVRIKGNALFGSISTAIREKGVYVGKEKDKKLADLETIKRLYPEMTDDLTAMSAENIMENNFENYSNQERLDFKELSELFDAGLAGRAVDSSVFDNKAFDKVEDWTKSGSEYINKKVENVTAAVQDIYGDAKTYLTQRYDDLKEYLPKIEEMLGDVSESSIKFVGSTLSYSLHSVANRLEKIKDREVDNYTDKLNALHQLGSEAESQQLNTYEVEKAISDLRDHHLRTLIVLDQAIVSVRNTASAMKDKSELYTAEQGKELMRSILRDTRELLKRLKLIVERAGNTD